MHNPHLIVVKAETGQEAMDIVETEIQDWGNENNWRSICGAVSEKNEVVTSGEGRFQINETWNTIKKINEIVLDWMKPSFLAEEGEKTISQLINGKIKLEDIEPITWLNIGQYAEFMWEKGNAVPAEKFNVLKDSYFEWKFTDCGVTHLNIDNDGCLWVVIVDFHS